jgi:Tol biopolymer transport system component
LRNPGISPTGVRAVFEARGEILTVPADKGDVRNLTNTPGVADRDPAWSPDGSKIAYFSDESGEYALHVRNQTGLGAADKYLLGETPAFFQSPKWSPDGKKVLYTDNRLNVSYIDLEKKKPVRIDADTYHDPVGSLDPCWSPDSQWICYASKERERRSLSKISASGGQPQRIPTNLVGSPTEPDWSPDGNWIAFTTQGRDFSICVVPAKGGDAIVLAAGEDPSWAPNSRTLVCARRQGGHYVLSLLDVPTKQVKDVSRISGISSQSQPSWAR